MIAELFGLVGVFSVGLLGLMRYLSNEAIQSAEDDVATVRICSIRSEAS